MSFTRSRARFGCVATCTVLVVMLVSSTMGTAGARTTGASTTACKKTSGEPVLVSTISNENGPVAQPYYKPTVLAAAKSVNCAGGIQGRPLKMVTCNGNIYLDPNLGQNCVRDAIAQGVIASASLSSPENAVGQAFANAGIPMVGTALNLLGLTSPLSFNMTSGAPGLITSLAAGAWDKGARRIRVLIFESNLAPALNGFANQALEPRGGKMLEPVQYPADPSVDDSAIIQSAINGADALLLLLNSPVTIKVVDELRAAGFTGLIGTGATIADPDVLKGVGPKEAKALVLSAGFYPATATKQPGIARYNADMDRYSPKTPRVESSIGAWSSVMVIADALNKAPTIDKEALLTVLNTYQFELGVSPDVDFANTGAFGIPRVFTTLSSLQKTKNLEYYTDGAFFDPTVPPTTKK